MPKPSQKSALSNWYRTTGSIYGDEITVVQAVRSTEHTLILLENGKEQRTPKVSTWQTYHPTREAAVEHIRKRLEAAADQASRKLQQAQSDLNEFNLRNPKS